MLHKNILIYNTTYFTVVIDLYNKKPLRFSTATIKNTVINFFVGDNTNKGIDIFSITFLVAQPYPNKQGLSA